MNTLKAENRNMDLKPKQLRRKGIVPGVLYGKNIDESLNIQARRETVVRFLRTNSSGSIVELMVDDKKFSALLREVTYTPATGQIEHLSFQTLVAGQTVSSTARFVLLNREKISAMVQQPLFEIPYKALPSHLVETITIDLENLTVGDSIRISDLDISKDPEIEILIPLDTLVVSIIEGRKAGEESEAEDKESETADEAPES